MVGGEGYFAILEALKRLFRHFGNIPCMLLLLKRRRKIEEGTFYFIQNKESCGW